jgi:DNA (cytosine-5)-methyltransferase 1
MGKELQRLQAPYCCQACKPDRTTVVREGGLLKYLSVCSGIEAATVAWHPLGWQAVGFSEIEKFPSQVLAHHYPNVPNFGDMTKFKEWNLESNIDVFVGGTPCQSFSVAGLRKGLDDPRGNLMLTYLAIADKLRPRWLVWENVPGVLSSNGGKDFGTFLGGLGELGYGFAYRVLDAQYFGVAQRRRRVFVVGYLGDWRRAAAVLFERHSLSGNPAPRRQKGKSVTASIGTGIESSLDCGVELTGPLSARDYKDAGTDGMNKNSAKMIPVTKAWPAEITSSLCASDGPKGVSDQYAHEGKLIAMAHGQGGAEIGIDRCPTLTCVHEAPIAAYFPTQPIALAENTIGRQPENGGNGDGFTDGGPMYTLNATGVHGVAQPISFDMAQITSKVNGTRVEPGLPVSTMAKGSQMHVALSVYENHPADSRVQEMGEVCSTVTSRWGTGGGNTPMVSAVGTDLYNGAITGDVAATMSTHGSDSGGSGPTVMQQMAVRRLTPKECERLQGFPDNYSDIMPKGKPTPDGPRYKALGNSMAVPVMAWIGKRIQEVDNL